MCQREEARHQRQQWTQKPAHHGHPRGRDGIIEASQDLQPRIAEKPQGRRPVKMVQMLPIFPIFIE